MATAARARRPAKSPAKSSANGPAEGAAEGPAGLLKVLAAAKAGDFSVRAPVKGSGIERDVAVAVNELIEANARMASEIKRVGKLVGRDGRINERAELPASEGAWKSSTEAINDLIDDLVRPTAEFARVIDAVAKGDLSQKMALRIEGQPVRGEFLRIRTTVNAMVDRLSSFADEVTRVAREVGTEGKLGGQARVKGVSGVWKDLTDNVNTLAGNLTSQVRNIAEVTTAVANGDLSKKITVDVRGEVLQLKDTINTMVDQLRSFADEVTRVAREVGTEGKLGGQAQVRGVSGVWKDLTENVNTLAGNLTGQVRNIAQVATAVAKGDLSQKITVDARGEVLELKDTINTMVDQLSSFADEVTRVAREVGTEGKLGGQAVVPGVSGVWKDLTQNVNSMASNLTDQVRNIAEVTTAVANGDLSQKITVDVRGEVLRLKDTINTMVDQLRSFAAEVTRVAREVGTEGKLGGQANVEGVSGVWKDLTDNVNTLAGNLTDQVRNIAQVTTAVARGDLSQKITVDARGEVLELKDTINTMVDQLSSFADEVTRVAREVGTEGKLGGQAQVKGVLGVWRNLTENVNTLAGNLTSQVRNIAEVTTAVARGDLSQKITVDARGEVLQLKDTINTMVDQLRSFAAEVTRVAREVGTEGKLGGQANVEGVSGVWKDLTDNVNQMASNLTSQVRNIAEVTTAVARGDLSQKITVDVRGEVLRLKDTINTMVDQLSSFADEVTRVAREVGTEGKLGGQAHVRGVSGVWKDLTENVNLMASNLTSQVRNIAGVATAVAKGDLSQKITVDVRGEILELKNTLNTMVDQLSSFADEVTRVAREVGTEGELGGQAQVRGVSGVWKDLTDNVNSMASSLTTQVRAIAAVSTAVTQGDLTRSITVEAQGEVDALKDTINQMIANLRETTKRNSEQDWLNSNLARFGGMMQGQRDLRTVSNVIMSELTPLVSAQFGAFFLVNHGEDGEADLELLATYGYDFERASVRRVLPGEGLVGQAAVEKKPIFVSNVPEGYLRISSSLGGSPPQNVVVLPALFEDRVMAVIELASFEQMSPVHQGFLEQLTETIGVVINAIEANTRTEELLAQSQTLAAELQKQQEELRETNAELAEKATLLAEQNERIEVKNREIEMARLALEEKAEQLALSSQYKSEFLANISHELRTPLNSLLILAKLLADNAESNLTDKQVEFARTILASGNDLLELINDILDLSKIEAGRMDVHPGEVSLAEVVDYVDRAFRPLVEEKGLTFDVALTADLPRVIETDEQRLQQILRNLLSNAVKFTEEGGVGLTITATDARSLSFSVRDTGIGIPNDRLGLIFEAFQQADGTTSRRFGGTGLGLSISAEIAKLLGGAIHVESAVDVGSVFTLTLPVDFARRDAGEPQAEAPALAPPRLAADPAGAVLLHPEFDDDRDVLTPNDRVVLIVEDDPTFAAMLLEVAHTNGFKGVVAHRGDTGFSLAHACRPDAILLDMGLPVMDGSELLARLKTHPATRETPVHIISGLLAEGSEHAADSTLEKPVTLEALTELFERIAAGIREGAARVLVVERTGAPEGAARTILDSLGQADVTSVRTAKAALAALEAREFACVVLDAKLPRGGAFALLDRLQADGRLGDVPVVVYESEPLTTTERRRLDGWADRVTVVAIATPERLLAETSAFLGTVVGASGNGRASKEGRQLFESFEGKRVLIVDDDIRNVFALASILEARGMEVEYAENGAAGIELLKASPGIDVVLMDVMMPEMDGYQTMAAIREIPEFASLPIVAVTAKAMKEDRDRCIAAGASEYIKKPVDPDELLATIGIWLYSQPAEQEVVSA